MSMNIGYYQEYNEPEKEEDGFDESQGKKLILWYRYHLLALENEVCPVYAYSF